MSLPPRVSGKRIQPKLRAMPLRKTPSAVYIQMHQLANEKERLQQELRMLSDRQQQIMYRLQEISQGLAQLEVDAENYADAMEMAPELLAKAEKASKQAAKPKQSAASKTSKTVDNNNYNSMTIEY